MSKVVEYVGLFHTLRDQIKESWTRYWQSADSTNINTNQTPSVDDDERETNFRVKVKHRFERLKKQTIRRIDRSSSVDQDFSHLTRSKSRKELLQISAAVMGIEFSYAAETAFVSPLLLNIGLRHRHMTLMWCLSPLVGFFVTPLLGSLSDGCKSKLGRRRPFILLLSIGIILGLILVPNGKLIGRILGDTYRDDKVVLAKGGLSDFQTIGQTFPTDSNLLTYSNDHNNLTESDTAVEREMGISGSVSESGFHSNKRKTSAYFSKYSPTLGEHGYRVRNNLATEDDSEGGVAQLLKALQSKSKTFGRETGIESSTNYSTPSQSQTLLELRGIISGMRLKKKDDKITLPPSDGKVEDKSLHEDENSVKDHPWGLVFTVLGTVLLDFDADACQSPSRAYMLDVTIPEDHARGLSTFTVMAGLGGSLGYFLGALNWENTLLGNFFGGQVRAVFTLVLFIFIACVVTTIRSFREIPLDRLWENQSGSSVGGIGLGGSRLTSNANKHGQSGPYARFQEDPDIEQGGSISKMPEGKGYGSTVPVHETSFSGAVVKNGESNVHPLSEVEPSEQMPTFKEYVKTIIQLPKSLQWLCLTNFFCWMSLVCYSLYFTDFVGEAVFLGDPTAPVGSILRTKYDDGVRFGCWGMSLYSLSCSLYSLCIERFVSRFGAKRVYITGQLVYSVGMIFMALFRHRIGVIVFSWTAGIMYATLFTMPYLLVARYHATETFDVDIDDLVSKPSQMRGLGTDVAIVSSMVFLAQMTQAVTLGSIVAAVGSTTAIVCAASVFAACGALSATRVLYLDL